MALTSQSSEQDGAAGAAGVARAPQQNGLSGCLWHLRYRFESSEGVSERSLADTWERVARALAAEEPRDRGYWQATFRHALDGFKFLPGGRILAGAGGLSQATLANCFVMGLVESTFESVFDRLEESAVTMQWGGGIGLDFSAVPPRSARSAGPVAYMRVWDAMCEALTSFGSRRGAMLGALRCDHPDVEEFIDAKRDAAALRNFNLSVLVTDEFMAAVAGGHDWPLCFPSDLPGNTELRRRWPGFGMTGCAPVRLVPARELWRRLVDAAYDVAEPGVLFIDRINRANNLRYCEDIIATNPCGEVPLPAHGACVLGSVNLTAFVTDAFGADARMDFDALEATAAVAVRMLDDAIDASLYPLSQQAEQARLTRRVGLGITGLANTLVMLGLRYDDERGRAMAQRLLACIRDSAYRTSIGLAEEKGAFPKLECAAYLGGEYARTLPAAIRAGIERNGLRNSHLLAIAPAGSISLLANNVSSGIEPMFALESERGMITEQGRIESYRVADYAYELWRTTHAAEPPPATFVAAAELTPEAHLAMVAALQPLVDGAISKTINVPANQSREGLSRVYEQAYALGIKGCTVFRPNPVTGEIVRAVTPGSCRVRSRSN